MDSDALALGQAWRTSVSSKFSADVDILTAEIIFGVNKRQQQNSMFFCCFHLQNCCKIHSLLNGVILEADEIFS